jgi:hypothetical protein
LRLMHCFVVPLKAYIRSPSVVFVYSLSTKTLNRFISKAF